MNLNIRSILLFFLIFSSCLRQDDRKIFKKIIQDFENFKPFDDSRFLLGDFSEERFERENLFYKKTYKRLFTVNKNLLSEQDKISHELLTFVIKKKIADFDFKTHYNPILSDAGFHNNLVYRVKKISSVDDAYDYIKTLEEVPNFVRQNIKLISNGLDMGISQPKIIFEGYNTTYDKHITPSYKNNFYYSPFLKLPNSIPNYIKDSLQVLAANIIRDSVIPSFKKIKYFFEKEYLPRTRSTIGVSQTPNGEKYYESRIRYYTTLELKPKEIYSIGIAEVEKIKKQMFKVISEVKFQGDFKEFLNFLRTNKKFYASSPNELLIHARDISKRLDEQLPRFFKHLPRQPYGVAPVPLSIAPKYTGGRYIPAPKDGTSPGFYWVNTYNLSSRPLFNIPALTAHEAVPGHHLQGALNKELPESIPKFRKDLYLSAFGEGWGLYSELLAEEMGVYTNPYEKFGQLSYSMWRACRLVVDTGIHAFNWTREQAIDYMLNNTALSEHEINTEVDRYISWPGQALSYKIGELKIVELRKEAEKKLKEKFNIRDFHESILKNGTLTLPLLEDQISEYIALRLSEKN